MKNRFPSIYPVVGLDGMRRTMFDAVSSIHRDPASLLPNWASPKVFKERKFIVCGSTQRSELRVLAKNAEVIGIVDDHLSNQQKSLFGIPLIDSETWIDCVRRDSNVVSCLLVSHWNGYEYFMKMCQEFDLPYLDPLHFIHLVRSNGLDTRGETGRFFWYGYEFFEHVVRHADQLSEVADRLADAFSRVSWYCVLLYRLTLNPFYLRYCGVGHNTGKFGLNSYSTNRQFFTFSDDEVYVDGGAFTGDTIEQFVNAVNGRFRHIYSFEPSPEHNREIRNRLRKIDDGLLHSIANKVSLIEMGLWSANATLSFNPTQILDAFDLGRHVNTQSAHLVETGILAHLYDVERERAASLQVPVTTTDEATNREATFIKLEIEGAELEALKGASGTIAATHPKLALSIYHKPEDMLTIPHALEQLNAGYRLGFRQHNQLAPDGMVLYCY